VHFPVHLGVGDFTQHRASSCEKVEHSGVNLDAPYLFACVPLLISLSCSETGRFQQNRSHLERMCIFGQHRCGTLPTTSTVRALLLPLPSGRRCWLRLPCPSHAQ
jgi:hypothetical protein